MATESKGTTAKPHTVRKFVTHTEKPTIDIGGVYVQGKVTADYAKLEQIFGRPRVFIGSDSDAEWWVEFDGAVVAVISNRHTAFRVDGFFEWHVAAHTSVGFNHVLDELAA